MNNDIEEKRKLRKKAINLLDKNARHAAQIHWHFYRETRSKTKEWKNNSHKDEMSASLLFIFTSSLSISSDEENRELWYEHFYRFFFRIHVPFISSRMFH